MRHSQRKREKVIKEFCKVGRVDLACAAAGVDRTTHYWWMKNDPEYRKSFEEAREEACGLLEDEAVRRAYKGTLRPQAIGGGKVMMVTEFSDQLLMFLLKCRNPKVFGDRREDTVHLDSQLSVVDILRSRRQRRRAREAAEEAAAKAAAITVDPQPLELESASEEGQEG